MVLISQERFSQSNLIHTTALIALFLHLVSYTSFAFIMSALFLILQFAFKSICSVHRHHHRRAQLFHFHAQMVANDE